MIKNITLNELSFEKIQKYYNFIKKCDIDDFIYSDNIMLDPICGILDDFDFNKIEKFVRQKKLEKLKNK